MARPSRLTPELRERIERELEQGVPVVVVAQRVGIGERTLHRWLKSGRVVRRERPDPLAVPPGTPAQSRAAAPSPDLDERLAAAEPALRERLNARSQRSGVEVVSDGGSGVED